VVAPASASLAGAGFGSHGEGIRAVVSDGGLDSAATGGRARIHVRPYHNDGDVTLPDSFRASRRSKSADERNRGVNESHVEMMAVFSNEPVQPLEHRIEQNEGC